MRNSEQEQLVEELSHLATKLFILTWYSPLTHSATPKLAQQQPFIRHIQTIITRTIATATTTTTTETETETETTETKTETETATNTINLLLLELPLTINRHLEFIQALQLLLRNKQQQDFNSLFIQLHPHPALIIQPPASTSPPVSPSYLRLLIQAILNILLPKQDYASEPARLIIRETLLNLLLLPLFTLLSQPSQIHRLLITHLPPPRPTPPAPLTPTTTTTTTKPGLLRPLLDLLNSLSLLLLHLPALLGTLIHLITAPPPFPLIHNPVIFIPILDLAFTLLGKPAHLVQLFWLLKIVSRIFHRLLLK
jgi:hypothetical protein